MKTLFVLCTKNPNQNLINNIHNIYNIQLYKENPDLCKICVIDSDSDSNNVMYFTTLKKKFPDVELHLCKNKNYEYGAWKYAYSLYPNYERYVCLQDSLIIRQKFDLDLVNNDDTALIFFDNSGFNSHRVIKNRGLEILTQCNLDNAYKNIVHTNFTLATHSSFVVNNKVMKDIFDTLICPPINKTDSCCYERIFGLYFIIKNIKTINIANFLNKIHGNRI
jgi:hypothetical protein